MSAAFTCKGCEKRKLGCHDICEKYKAEKTRWKNGKAELRKGCEANDYIINRIYKSRKRKNIWR